MQIARHGAVAGAVGVGLHNLRRMVRSYGMIVKRLQVKPTYANCKMGAYPWFCRENSVS